MKNTLSLFKVISLSLIILLLSGCLYPESELEKNQVPNEDQLEQVQRAVEKYRDETNGLVPIRTKPNETPIFEKYLIDFSLLKDRNLLTEIPGNAYENGGVYQYALITPEDNPTVKLIDLRLTEKIRSVYIRLNAYRDEHIYPPYGELVEEGIFTIDYEKLGLDSPPTVTSPYSQEQLPIVMDTDGNLFIDYRMDLTQALENYEHNYEEGDDIRYLLAENTPFLPVYSVPYTISDGKPVFMLE